MIRKKGDTSISTFDEDMEISEQISMRSPNTSREVLIQRSSTTLRQYTNDVALGSPTKSSQTHQSFNRKFTSNVYTGQSELMRQITEKEEEDQEIPKTLQKKFTIQNDSQIPLKRRQSNIIDDIGHKKKIQAELKTFKRSDGSFKKNQNISEVQDEDDTKRFIRRNSVVTEYKPTPLPSGKRRSIFMQLFDGFDRKEQKVNYYQDFSLKDLKELENCIDKNKQDLQEELNQFNQKQIEKKIVVNASANWKRAKSNIKAVQMIRKVMRDIKKFGTSYAVAYVDGQQFNEIKKQKLLEEANKDIDQKKNNGYLFMPEDQFPTIYWMMLVIFLFLYIAVLSPIRLFCFYEVSKDDAAYMNLYYLHLSVDCLFLVDIMLTFNLAYLDYNGDIVNSRLKILENYAKGWLFIDVLSVFPFDFMGIDDTDFYLRASTWNEIIKLIRLPQFYQRIRNSSGITDIIQLSSQLRRILWFLTNVMICTHFMGCLWLYIGVVEASKQKQNWIMDCNLDPEDSQNIYLFSLYWAITTITTVGFGDIHPFTDLERFVAICWIAFGAGFYSYTVGSLSQMFGSSTTREQRLQNNTHIVDEFCNESNISRFLQLKIRKALQHNSYKSILNGEEKEEFFESVPLHLKYMIADNMFHGIISKVPFFRRKDSMFLAYFLTMLEPLELQQGEYVFHKGEQANMVYFLTQGRVNFLAGGQELCFKTFVAGSYFGELEIFRKCMRLFHVRCETKVDMMTIDREYFTLLLQRFPKVEKEMKAMSKLREEKIRDSLMRAAQFQNIGHSSNFWDKNKTRIQYKDIVLKRKNQEFQNIVKQHEDELEHKNNPNSIEKQSENSSSDNSNSSESEEKHNKSYYSNLSEDKNQEKQDSDQRKLLHNFINNQQVDQKYPSDTEKKMNEIIVHQQNNNKSQQSSELASPDQRSRHRLEAVADASDEAVVISETPISLKRYSLSKSSPQPQKQTAKAALHLDVHQTMQDAKNSYQRSPAGQASQAPLYQFSQESPRLTRTLEFEPISPQNDPIVLIDRIVNDITQHMEPLKTISSQGHQENKASLSQFQQQDLEGCKQTEAPAEQQQTVEAQSALSQKSQKKLKVKIPPLMLPTQNSLNKITSEKQIISGPFFKNGLPSFLKRCMNHIKKNFEISIANNKFVLNPRLESQINQLTPMHVYALPLEGEQSNRFQKIHKLIHSPRLISQNTFVEAQEEDSAEGSLNSPVRHTPDYDHHNFARSETRSFFKRQRTNAFGVKQRKSQVQLQQSDGEGVDIQGIIQELRRSLEQGNSVIAMYERKFSTLSQMFTTLKGLAEDVLKKNNEKDQEIESLKMRVQELESQQAASTLELHVQAKHSVQTKVDYFLRSSKQTPQGANASSSFQHSRSFQRSSQDLFMDGDCINEEQYEEHENNEQEGEEGEEHKSEGNGKY